MFKQGIVARGSRGLVLFHSTGSGKTLSSLALAVAAHTSGRRYRVVLVTTPENARSNGFATYTKNLATMFPSFAPAFGLPPVQGDPDAWARQHVIPASKFQIMNIALRSTLEKVVAAVKEGRERVIFIIDEAQNLWEPTGSYRAGRNYANLQWFKKQLGEDAVRKNSFLFLVSATPAAGSVKNWIASANLVRPFGTPPIDARLPSPSSLRGLVSFVDLRGDRSVSGVLQGPFNLNIEMSSAYYTAYLKAIATSVAEEKALRYPDCCTKGRGDVDPRLYLKTALLKSLGLTATDLGKGRNKLVRDSTHNPTVKVGNTTLTIGEKCVVALEHATRAAGKQYIYVNNPAIAQALGEVLKHKYGYKLLKAPRATGHYGPKQKQQRAQSAVRHGKSLMAKTEKRFCLMKTGVVGGGHKQGDEDITTLKNMINDDSNLHGEQCHIIIASGGYFEGLDINALRGVHLLSPLSTHDNDQQAVGRAIRTCGHAKLPPRERNCVVKRYFAVPPKHWNPERDAEKAGMKEKAASLLADKARRLHRKLAMYFDAADPSADERVFRDAVARSKDLTKFEECLKGKAFDCLYLKNVLGFDHACGGEGCGGGSGGGGGSGKRKRWRSESPQRRTSKKSERATGRRRSPVALSVSRLIGSKRK